MSITQSKRAFITGVYGQDGSYLAEYLLAHGYEILGLIQETDLTHENAKLFAGAKSFSTLISDLRDTERIALRLKEFNPDEIYNIAAVSDLKTAAEKPEYTYEVNFIAFKKLTESAFQMNPRVRVFQALSSRILTPNDKGVIDERSALSIPKNTYDEAKRDSYEKVVVEGRTRGHYIAAGFLCNHESPRRSNRFVTGKIATAVAEIALGRRELFSVGNTEALRDWSHAQDVIRGIHAILSVERAQDYVIGSGELHSVRDFIHEAFKTVGTTIVWEGDGLDSRAFDEKGILRVTVDESIYQKDDNPVVSDTRKLEVETGWKRRISFKELVSSMVKARLRLI